MSRPGLFDVLDQAVEGRVTVVSAPAGSGKTLLVHLDERVVLVIDDLHELRAADAVAQWRGEPAPPAEALSRAELRVLRYLPSNLSGSEISAELFVSPNTVGTHLRHIYAKLGVHRRSDAVRRARRLGLLAPAAWPS